MRQLVAEIMREHGFTDEEIKERGLYASSMIPTQVDRELTPESIAPLRAHLEGLYQLVQADPAGHAAWAESMAAKLTSNN